MYSLPALDFMGRTPAVREQGIPLVYLLITLLLLMTAWFDRHIQSVNGMARMSRVKGRCDDRCSMNKVRSGSRQPGLWEKWLSHLQAAGHD